MFNLNMMFLKATILLSHLLMLIYSPLGFADEMQMSLRKRSFNKESRLLGAARQLKNTERYPPGPTLKNTERYPPGPTLRYPSTNQLTNGYPPTYPPTYPPLYPPTYPPTHAPK
jgi:hypothetical protein